MLKILSAVLLALCVTTVARGDDEGGSDCQICGAWIPTPRQEWRTGNTRYVYIGKRRLKTYCPPCQRDINNGKIDPSDPPLLGPRDSDEAIDGKKNPFGVEKLDLEGRKIKPLGKDESSGFGAIGWVAGIVVALGAVLKYLLK